MTTFMETAWSMLCFEPHNNYYVSMLLKRKNPLGDMVLAEFRGLIEDESHTNLAYDAHVVFTSLTNEFFAYLTPLNPGERLDVLRGFRAKHPVESWPLPAVEKKKAPTYVYKADMYATDNILHPVGKAVDIEPLPFKTAVPKPAPAPAPEFGFKPGKISVVTTAGPVTFNGSATASYFYEMLASSHSQPTTYLSPPNELTHLSPPNELDF